MTDAPSFDTPAGHIVGWRDGRVIRATGIRYARASRFQPPIAEPREQFYEWLRGQAQDASEPSDPVLRAGDDAFMKGGCPECHTIRGTRAEGTNGPDLTHVGSRHSLAAGTLKNHIGTMAGWIAGSQDVKPGNAMPNSNTYSGEELRAVSAWLGSLQ